MPSLSSGMSRSSGSFMRRAKLTSTPDLSPPRARTEIGATKTAETAHAEEAAEKKAE